MQQVILGGPGSSGAARQYLFLAQQQKILSREQVEAWLNEAKSEQELRKQLINIASA